MIVEQIVYDDQLSHEKRSTVDRGESNGCSRYRVEEDYCMKVAWRCEREQTGVIKKPQPGHI